MMLDGQPLAGQSRRTRSDQMCGRTDGRRVWLARINTEEA